MALDDFDEPPMDAADGGDPTHDPTHDPMGMDRLDDWPDEAPPQPMSLAEAKALLSERHNISMDAGDPVLMLVTLHQGFIADHEKLMAHHARAMRQVMEKTSTDTTEAVGQALAVLHDETLEGALQNTLAKISEEARLMGGFLNTVDGATRRLKRSLGVLTIVTWVAALIVLAALILLLTQ